MQPVRAWIARVLGPATTPNIPGPAKPSATRRSQPAHARLELESLEDRTLLSGGTGLTGQYFAAANFSQLKVTRTDPTVNFDWGYDQSPTTGVPGDHFSVRWTGYVQPLYSQTYTFYTRSDDGARLFVDGQEIINNWTAHTSTENSGTIRLTAGQKYKIELDFYQNSGDAQIRLAWSSASQAKQVIPTGQLFPSMAAPTANYGPAGKLTASNVTAAAATSYTFTVTYSDSDGVLAGSLRTGNVRVIGPKGFSQLATLEKISQTTNGPSITATYRITPPGGSWDSGDNGTYSIFLLANQVKDVKGNYSAPTLLGSFQVTAPAVDWFTTHLQDTTLRNEVRTLDADHVLSRTDMLTLLRSVEGGGVTSTELTDLKTLLSNSTYLGMPDYVRELTGKIVYGDPANMHYQGHYLGNLFAGSPGTQLEMLIDKWFLGKDHPTALSNTHYVLAQGTLFGSGPTYTDIKQGEVGDCYYLAALGEVVSRNPSAIRGMFIDNGDGTYTVRFYHSGVADYVTVDKYLPVSADGTFAYASFQASASNPANKLWVGLAEKAYAELAESGWSRSSSTANSYNAINLGWEGDAVHQITGRVETYQVISNTSITLTNLVNSFNSGKMIGLDSKPTTSPDVVANHVYVMIGYSSGMFRLYNPWGSIQYMSWSKVAANFEGWSENQ
jgi:hypothetical protein